MSFIYLALLAPLLPLVGVSFGFAIVVVFAVTAALLLFGAAITADASAVRLLFLSQEPLCLLVSLFSILISKKLSSQNIDGNLNQIKKQLSEMRAIHAEFKNQTLQAEGEESRSLQIYGMAKSLAEALSWKDMAPRLSTGIQKVFGAHEFLLYSISDGQEWTLLHRRGSWAKEPPMTGAVSAASQFLYPPQTLEVVPVQVVPIFNPNAGQGQVTGMLFLKCAAEKPNDDLLEAGEQFGEQLGMALSKAMLFNQMEINSRLDGLTGLLRRQAFMDRLGDELKRANAFHTPFCLLMIDIDHFKLVNDGHGHAAGDAVLARVGQILKESIYETDVVGRYGGEEFIVLLPHAQLDGVMRKANLLRQRFEKETISSGFEQLKITVSIGLSYFPNHGRTAEELIGRADAALYQAKDKGRNRVIAAA